MIEDIGEGHTVSMLALQPEQWVTWEGALGMRRSGLSIIHEALSKMRSDKLIVTFHADKRDHISQMCMREVWLSDPRLELLPDEFSSGLSELFLPFVDELITVSSNLGMSAFLLGKRIKSLGTSFVSTLECLQTNSDLLNHKLLQASVLSYLTNKIGVSDVAFNNPTMLLEKINTILSEQLPSREFPPKVILCDDDYRLKIVEDDPYPDLRVCDLIEVHELINKTLSVGASLQALFTHFGRHALPYLLGHGVVGAEFGVAKGYFSESLLLSGKFDRLYSIDRWSDHHDDEEFSYAQDRLSKFGDKSVVLRMSFEDALSLIPDNSLEFLYVDGYAHTGHDADIVRMCLKKLKLGAIVAVHDYDRFSFPANFRALTELFQSEMFSELQIIPGVLTKIDEDIFPSVVASYCC